MQPRIKMYVVKDAENSQSAYAPGFFLAWSL